MHSTDPIRLSDIREASANAPAITRAEAERQFKLSFALVIILTLGTLGAIATLPLNAADGGYGLSQQATAAQAADVKRR